MSSYIRLANLIELYSIDSNGNETREAVYTNGCEPGKTLSYDGKTFGYLSFIYQGAAKSRTGDNLQAGLILSTNPLSTGIAAEAIKNRYHLRVWSVTINPDRDQVAKLLTLEDWVVASMVYDPEAVEVVLSSSIDAVGANAPTRVLTRKLVGALPITASIRVS